MRTTNHILLGVLFAGLFLLFVGLPPLYWPLLLGVVFGSIFPDLDVHLAHRKTLHNLTALVLVAGYMAFYKFPFYFTVFFTLGFLSHLAADALTVRGVMPFYPFFGWKISGPLKNGGIYETFFMFLIAVAMVILYAMTGGRLSIGW